jgi:hypothetical protein
LSIYTGKYTEIPLNKLIFKGRKIKKERENLPKLNDQNRVIKFTNKNIDF